MLFFCLCCVLCFAPVFPSCLFVLLLFCFSACPLLCLAFLFLRLSVFPLFFLPSACVCSSFSTCSCFSVSPPLLGLFAFCFSAFMLRSYAPPFAAYWLHLSFSTIILQVSSCSAFLPSALLVLFYSETPLTPPRQAFRTLILLLCVSTCIM